MGGGSRRGSRGPWPLNLGISIPPGVVVQVEVPIVVYASLHPVSFGTFRQALHNFELGTELVALSIRDPLPSHQPKRAAMSVTAPLAMISNMAEV